MSATQLQISPPMESAEDSFCLPFEHLFRLMASETTAGLVQRKFEAIVKVIEACKGGFRICQLDHVCELLDLLLPECVQNQELQNQKNLEDMEEAKRNDRVYHAQPDQPDSDTVILRNLMCRVILLCGKPLVSDKSNAEYVHADKICRMLHAAARCLECPVLHLRVSAADTLHMFARGEGERAEHAADDMRPSKWMFHQQLLDRSGVIEQVVQVFHEEVDHLFDSDENGDGQIDSKEYANAQDFDLGDENPDPPVFMVSLMKMVYQMSAFKDNALTLIRSKTSQLMIRVASAILDFRKPEVALMIQVLWNVMDHSLVRLDGAIATTRMQLLDKHRHANALYLLGTAEVVGMLRSLLERLLQEGYQLQDKELRNEVIIVALLLASRQENHALYHETGFLSLLLLYATAEEMELPTGCNANHYATTDEYDLQMKQLMWQLIMKLSAHEPKNIALVADSLLLQTALSYIDPMQEQNSIKQRWSPIQLEILQQDAIALLFTFVPQFSAEYRKHGGTAIILAFLRTWPNAALMASALRFLRISCLVPSILAEVGEQDGVQSMLDLVCTPHTVSSMDAHAFAILSMLCAGNITNQTALRTARGIAPLVKLLHYDPSDLSSTDTLCAEAVLCVWTAVVGNIMSETQLIAQDSIHLLLCLVESAPEALRDVALGCLTDLLRNPAAAPYFAGWRSASSTRNAVQVLLDLWLDFEISHGIIADKSQVMLDTVETVRRIAPASLAASSRAKDVRSYTHQDASMPHNLSSQAEMAATIAKISLREPVRKRLKGNLANLISAVQMARGATAKQDVLVSLLEGPYEEPVPATTGWGGNNIDDAEDVDGNSGEKDAKSQQTFPWGPKEIYRSFMDVRMRIFGLLAVLDMDALMDSDVLSQDEQVILRMAKELPRLLRGVVWNAVATTLKDQGVRPILADRKHIDVELSGLRDLARDVRLAQRQVVEQFEQTEQDEDKKYFERILSQRDQEVQFMLLNKKAKKAAGISLTRRHESKMKKKEMLARSRVDVEYSDNNSHVGEEREEDVLREEDEESELVEEESRFEDEHVLAA